jgi:hypothetical protein
LGSIRAIRSQEDTDRLALAQHGAQTFFKAQKGMSR